MLDFKIRVFSRQRMVDLYDNHPDILDRHRIISVSSPGELSPFEDVEHPNLLKLYFDDVEVQSRSRLHPGYEMFSQEDAKKVIGFLKGCDQNLIVHCHAGVSRSGAIGLFAAEYLNADLDYFYRMNPQIWPNQRVLRLLKQCARRIN